MVIGHHRVIAGFLNAEYRHVGYLLPSILKSVRFGGFAPLYRRPASHEGKDMGGYVCAAHRRKNRGFPTLKRTLNLGIEKGRLLKNSRPKGGLIQVICYPTSPETVDITGFFEKFCIAIRTRNQWLASPVISRVCGLFLFLPCPSQIAGDFLFLKCPSYFRAVFGGHFCSFRRKNGNSRICRSNL